MAQMYSTGLQATSPGLGLISFGFRTDTANDPDYINDPGNFVTSITETGTGLFTVTLASSCRPKSIVSANVSIGCAAATVALTGEASMLLDRDAYDPATGVFTIQNTLVDVDGVSAAGAAGSDWYVSVLIVGQFAQDLARP